jgi:predicted nucleic-acid-binding protein
MNLLIDTHALIWFITDNDKLPFKTKQIIENKENNCSDNLEKIVILKHILFLYSFQKLYKSIVITV